MVLAVVLVPNFYIEANHSPVHSSGSGVSFQLPANSKFTGFIKWFFPALLVTAAILAMAMIVLAGFQWVTAYGNPSKIEDARDRIFNAIIGLILALAAWLILNTINPELVKPRFLGFIIEILNHV